MANYIRGNVDETLALGTLAATTLISANFDEVMVEMGRITSVVATWSIENWTVAAGDGPIIVGLAHSDYNDAEKEAVLEASASWNRGDKVAQEVSRRLMRTVGTFRAPPGGGIGVSVLNEGRPIKTKLNWSIITGKTLNIWAYNAGSSAFATTDPQIHLAGHANIFLK